ncbi:MAG: bifunctional folylpolyglutamate synthase/dihydrofolate synthase [Flavobacteriales bacterium]
MTYQETIQYLYAQLPMFQRVGQAAYKADLSNITRICDLLGNPQTQFKSIHVAGTNGKGSVTHMLASVLQEAGYKVGIYCSPHLVDFRERVKINGQMISKQEVIDFVAQCKDLFDEINPSFFEYTTALAFQCFAKQRVDVAVVEVGLGGRLDSTNVITPELSVITNIGLDHTNILGDTLEKISLEKAGIIKNGIPVLIGEKQKETEKVFEEVAAKNNSKLIYAKEVEIVCDLNGIYQEKNIATAFSAIQLLKEQGWKIDEKAIENGFLHVAKNTAFMGRWQVLGSNPSVVCDTGHNKEGVEYVVQQLAQEKYEQLHIVWGAVKDKDQTKVLDLLPKNAIYYFCAPNLERAMPAQELKDLAQQKSLQGKAYASVNEAFTVAKNAANAADFVFVGGSTFVVAEVLSAIIYE